MGSLRDELADMASVRFAVESAGGTRAAAAEYGVTQRTVQRWLKAEAGEGGQIRHPRGGFPGAGDMAKYGARAAAGGITADGRHRDMPPGGNVYIPPEALRDFLAAMRARDYDAAADAFEEAFADEYGFDAFGDQYGFGAGGLASFTLAAA